MSRRAHRTISLASSGAAIALLISACSSSSTTEGTTSDAPAESPPAASSAPSASTSPLSGDVSFLAQVVTPDSKGQWQEKIDRFTAANPGVNVELLFSPDSDVNTYFKQLLATGDLPDVAYALNPALLKDELTTWDTSDPDVQQIRSIPPQLVGGELYDLGVDVQARNLVFYNEDLFAAAGVTEFPTTWADFDAALQQLKDSGTVPLCMAGEWVTGRIFMGLNDIFPMDAEWNSKRTNNEVKFSDPNWVEAAERFQTYAKNGYFGDGALGTAYAQVEQNFLQGKCAMYQMGNWFTGSAAATPPNFDVGVAVPPSADGKVRVAGALGGANFSVLNGAQNKDAAIALAKFLAFDPLTHQELVEQNGFLSGLTFADSVPWNFTDLQKETADFVNSADSLTSDFIGQGDNSSRPGIADAVNALAQRLISDPGADIPAELAELDRIWDKAGS